MGRCLGRARALAVALLMLAAVGLLPALVSAQDEEIIADPELAGSSKKSDRGASSDDEVIADPELSGGAQKSGAKDNGWGGVYKSGKGEEEPKSSAPEAPEEPDPMANTGIAKLEISGQTAIDTHAEENMEDFYEARLRFGGEVDFRISRRLRLSIGTRIDFGWYAPFQGDRELDDDKLDMTGEPIRGVNGKTLKVHRGVLQEDRFEIDIIPLAAYVDATIADGVHLRVGEQVISLARMDGLSVTDMLAVVDFRPQTKNDPAGLKLAQPAIRLDWDFNSWATLQLVYVPWFMPHLMRPNRDNYVGQGTAAAGTASRPPAFVSKLIDPSFQPKAQEESLRFVGPAPDFSHPQAELRLNFRGSSFELALLGGTALEKLPSIYYTPLVNKLLAVDVASDNDSALLEDALRAGQLAAGLPTQCQARSCALVDIEYHRYYLVGFDGSFDIAPLQVGFELAYSPSRHLYTADRRGNNLPLPDVSKQIADADDLHWTDPNIARTLGSVDDRRIRKGVQMIQAALHVEYLKGESLLLAAEGYLYQAMKLPHDDNREWLGFPKGKGTYLAGLVSGSYNIQEGKYRFDCTVLVTMGPSYIITPQIEFQLSESFYLNIGAQFYEGPTPNNLAGRNRTRVATNLTPGGILSGYDNVYLGFRWTP
jgi:hypothetical protein